MKINITSYIKLFTIILVMSVMSIPSKAQTVCDCLSGTFTAYAVAEPGTFETIDHTQIYILTDATGNTITSNTSGSFPNLLGNTDYLIYAANVANNDVADFQNNLNTIIEVSTISGAYADYCYELNSGSAAYNCTCSCPTIGSVSTTGPICDSETFDITATGIAGVLQTENNETDFQILFGYYNGSEANPNPYIISPDVLFAMGTAVTPLNGTASLTGMGLTLNPGTYTVVAYLSSAPVDATCQPIAVTEVVIIAEPIVELGDDIQACAGDQIILDAGAGFSSYSWSNGATTQTTTVTQSGIYSVNVGNDGVCVDSDDVEVVFNNINAINVETSICEGDSYTLEDGTMVSEAGTYVVTIASTSDCGSEITTVLTINNLPVFSIDGDLNICSDGTGQTNSDEITALSADPGFESYLWSTGQTNQSIIVNAAGEYSVSITDSNGCIDSATVIVVENDCSIFVCPEIAAVNTDSPYCVGETIDITVTGIANTLQTENGESDFGILIGAYNGEVLNPDPYTSTPNIVLNFNNPFTPNAGTVTLADIGPINNEGIFTIVAYLAEIPQDASCRPSASVIAVVNDSPMEPEPNNPFTACEGEPVIFSAPDGYSYLWATDASIQQVTVFNTTSLPLTITNANGCSQTLTYESLIIEAPDEPQPAITSICGFNEVALNGPAGYNYLWSDGSTTQSILAATVGFYELTIANAAACTQVLSYEVIGEGLNLPNPEAIGICGVQSVTLQGPSGFTYQWSTGETTQSINVSSVGVYTLTVTESGGCSQDLVYNVTSEGNLNLSNPAPKEICTGEFVSLTGPQGFSYLWSNGSVSRIISVNAPGVYVLEVSDVDGCTQTLNYVVILADVPNESQPTPIAACAGEVVNLQAPEGYSYSWSGGEQSSNINVTETGTYNVEISNGCTQTLSFEATFLPLPTIVVVGQNPSACGVDDGIITITLTGVANGIYDLTFKAGTFENVLVMNGAATVTGLAEGFYNFITITNESGCTAVTDNTIDLVSPNFVEPPTVSGINQYCEDDPVKSVIASGRDNAVFIWYADEALTNVIYTGSSYIPQGISETVYVTQTLEGNCESAASSFIITFSSLPILQNQTITKCADGNEAFIDLHTYENAIGVVGGTWADNAGAIANTSAYMFTNFNSITYTVINNAGCIATASIKLIIEKGIVNTQAVSICDNPAGNFIDILANNIWNEEAVVIDWTSNGEIVFDPSNAQVTQNGQVFELITETDDECDAKNLLIVNIAPTPIVEAVASCRNSNNQNEFFIDVVTTKNPSFNSIVIADGNTEQTALGNNQVTFGPYTHSGSGLADITFEAYFEEDQTCPVTVNAKEVLCGPAQSCNCNDPENAGTILAQSQPGTFTNENHTQIYVLTSAGGNIVANNNTGLFTSLGNSEYSVYSINVDNFDAAALNTALNSESNISSFIPSKSYSNFCYEISNAANYSISCNCLPFTCPSIVDVNISGDICAGETFDVMVTGIANVAQTQNNETDFEILIGYYNKFVASPNPYNTAPDGLLNGGNPVSVTDGVAELMAMGASLPSDNYTIVAYLSPAPSDSSCIPMNRAFIKIHESPTINPTVKPICVGNNGVIHPNISGGLFPYKIDWATPAGETFTVATFTVAQAILADAGTYTITATDVRGCSNNTEVDVQVIDTDLGYQEVFVCENIAGGAVDAIVDLTIYESGFGVESGTWIDESNNIVVDASNVSLIGTNDFRFEYHLDNEVQCQGEGVLLLNISRTDSPFCGDPVTCDCDNPDAPLSIFAIAQPGTFNNVGYSNIYLLTDADGAIISFNDTGLFTTLLENTAYNIYAANVDNAKMALFETALSNANIDAVANQTGNFTDLCYELSTGVANFNEVCDCVIEIPCLANAGITSPQLNANCDCNALDAPLTIMATVQGSFNAVDHTNFYLLSDAGSNIINYNTNGIFDGLSDQSGYNIYVVNVDDNDLALFETELANGATLQQLNNQAGSLVDLCYDVNASAATYSETCDCEPPVDICLANAGTTILQTEEVVFCAGNTVGPFEVNYTAETAPGVGFTYIWIATDGAPNYNILAYTETDATDLIGSFNDLQAGNYCIHGFSFEGTFTTFENYVADNNIDNGLQVDLAITAGTICADLLIDCISVEVKDLPVADINPSANLCNISGGASPTEIDLNSLIIDAANFGTAAWYTIADGTEPLTSTIITSETLAIGTTNFYYIIDDEFCRSINYTVNVNVLDCAAEACTYTLNNSEIVCNADGSFSLALTVGFSNVLSDEFYATIGGVDYGPFTDTDNDGTELINIENIVGGSGNTLTIADGQSGEATPPQAIFISELHYDNISSDVNESIELTALAGTDLSNYTIELYNGNGGAVYNTMMLSGIIVEEANGYGTAAFVYPANGIQNGPDAAALINVSDAENPTVVEFIGYELEGTPFFATDGTAVGLQPLEIGAAEPGEVGESLQLTDLGWVGPITDSFGSLNENLTLETTSVAIDCSYSFDLEFPPCGACSLNVTATPVNCEINQFYIDVAVNANNPTGSQYTIDYIVFGFVVNNYGNFDYSDGTINIGPFPADDATTYDFIVRDVDSSECQGAFSIDPQSCAPLRNNEEDDIPIDNGDDPLELVFEGWKNTNETEVGTFNEITNKGKIPIAGNATSALKTTINYLRPNPVTNILYIGIHSKASNNLHFEVVDVTGRVMMRDLQATSKGINEVELGVSNYKPGIYFIKLLQGDTLMYKKFIKE